MSFITNSETAKMNWPPLRSFTADLEMNPSDLSMEEKDKAYKNSIPSYLSSKVGI